MTNQYHENNRASAVLAKIGNGCADADFARAMADVIARVLNTGKKAKLVLTIEVAPREDMNCLEMRADVVAKLPKLPAPASQMHVGSNGELLTQMDFLLGGGQSEAPKPVAPDARSSSRLVVVATPAPAPVAAAPAPAPLKTGKDAAAGKDN